MITTSYAYSSSSGFVFDPTKIGFSGSAARLLLVPNPGLTTSPAVASSTFDPSLLVYTAGMLQQVDQRPADATFYASFATVLNANWATGSTTVTGLNGAAINNGALDLTGDTNASVTFSPVGNADSLEAGTIEIQVIPNYTGSPPEPQYFYYVATGISDGKDSISLFHDTTGLLNLDIIDDTSTIVVSIDAAVSFVSGVTYTILVQYDGIAGHTRLFVNGTLVGSDLVSTFTRSGPLGYASIGPAVGHNNFSAKNLSIYSTVVTPSSPVLTPTIYAAATAALPQFHYSGLGSLQAFSGFSTVDSGGLRYILNDSYWNGATWISSDGSFAQANDPATISTNIGSLPASNMLSTSVVFTAQNTSLTLTSVTITYSGELYSMSDPTIAPNASLTMDSMSSFIAVLASSGGDGVGFFLLVNSVNIWWNGSAWVTSNGSFAQSNPAAVVAANLATLPFSQGVFLTPYAVLHSLNGSTTPSLTSLTLIYDFFAPPPSGPNVCTIFGYIIDETNSIVPGAIVTVQNPTTFENQGYVVAQGSVQVTTNNLGYFSIDLVETVTVSKFLTFSVRFPGGRASGSFSFGKAIIPNMPEANITSLTFT